MRLTSTKFEALTEGHSCTPAPCTPAPWTPAPLDTRPLDTRLARLRQKRNISNFNQINAICVFVSKVTWQDFSVFLFANDSSQIWWNWPISYIQTCSQFYEPWCNNNITSAPQTLVCLEQGSPTFLTLRAILLGYPLLRRAACLTRTSERNTFNLPSIMSILTINIHLYEKSDRVNGLFRTGPRATHVALAGTILVTTGSEVSRRHVAYKGQAQNTRTSTEKLPAKFIKTRNIFCMQPNAQRSRSIWFFSFFPCFSHRFSCTAYSLTG